MSRLSSLFLFPGAIAPMRPRLFLAAVAALGIACSLEAPGGRDGVTERLDAGGAAGSGESAPVDSVLVGDATVGASSSSPDGGGLNAQFGVGSSSDGGPSTGNAGHEGGVTMGQVDPDAGGGGAPPSGFDWKAGDYPPELHEQNYLEIVGVPGQAGKTRGYKVHVPQSYDPAVPAPVLFALHGYQQNAAMFVVEGTSLVGKSDREGFVLVMPNGVQEDLLGGSWNAGVCCGAAAAQKLDDVGLMRAFYAEVRKHVNIDSRRVYATGLSNGAFMAHRLGCEAADLFAAIAPLAGTIGTAELGATGTNLDPDFKSCDPVRSIAVLYMHGDGDLIVPYASMQPTLDYWARKNGCTTTGPATHPASGGDTTCVTYAECKAGVEVTGCTVKGGGHCWFGDPSCGTGAPGIGALVVGNNSDFLKASDAAWEFVSRFQRK
jgi:polyhydroxybutyrate depolymerase